MAATLAWMFASAPTPARAVQGKPVPPTPAADTLVVVVSAQRSAAELSRVHLLDLYLGRTSRFPDGTPAEPIDLEPGSAAREAFYQTYLNRSQAEIRAHWSKIIFTGRGRPPRDVSDGEEMKELIAGNPRAIGYIERHLVDESVRVVRIGG